MDGSKSAVEITNADKDATYTGENNSVSLLDLPDDVLLIMLQFFSPRDLKALGYTCQRFGSLIKDRKLWEVVDTREYPIGCTRLQWLIDHVLNENTRELMLTGYIKDNKILLNELISNHEKNPINLSKGQTSQPEDDSTAIRLNLLNELHMLNPTMMRRFRLYQSSDEGTPESMDNLPSPQCTVTQTLLRELQVYCPNLTSFSLEYCNLNCQIVGPKYFPPTIKKLSLRGLRCCNEIGHKCFVSNIQSYLPLVEFLDVSECDWLEPVAILSLSKMPVLRHLVMCKCYKMCEFVAYASLAARYGFRKLKILDLRYTPVGDAEVSSFGWLPELEEFYVSCSLRPSHPIQLIPILHRGELESWESEDPGRSNIRPNDKVPIEDIPKSTNDNPQNAEPRRSASCSLMVISTRNVHNINYHQVNIAKRKMEPNKNGENGSDENNDPTSKRNKPNEANSSAKNDHDKHRDANNAVAGTSKNGNNVENLNGSSNTNNLNKNPESIEDESSRDNDSDDDDDGPPRVVMEFHEPRQENIPLMRSPAIRFLNINLNDSEPVEELDTDPESARNQPTHIYYLSMEHSKNSQEKMCSHPYCNDLEMRRSICFRGPCYNMPLFDCVESEAMVTDLAIKRFGTADDDDVSYIFIGPNAAEKDAGSRPEKSNLKILSVTGYKTITNKSLVHLATAAPKLVKIDFTSTNVTPLGVGRFKSIRPDCEVIFSPYKLGSQEMPNIALAD